MARACPDCAEPLAPRQTHGLTLDVCPRCAGIYFDEGEMAALQQAGPQAVDAVEDAILPESIAFVDSPTPKRCPGCGKAMHAYTYRYSSQIRLDGCEACGGVWVQDGELGKIADHLEAPPSTFGGTPSARAAAEPRNAEAKLRDHAARRHANLVQRVLRHLKR